VADETNYLGIYMGANGKWNVRCVNSIFELKPQTLSNVLNHYLMVTDKPYRDFDEVVQEDYLWHNWEASAKSLMEKMQVVITELV
jgi:lipoprotein NlpI